MIETGPRGSRLVVESTDAVPLTWFQVAIRGGSAGDPEGGDGFTYHMATLARRGAGARTRAQLDEELDLLGTSLTMSVDRDAVKLSGLCLDRNLDRLVDMAADVLARPRMDLEEHQRLLRESRMALDEVRDDDSHLVSRFFNRHCVPGHPYGRSILGTETTLERIERDAVQAAYRRSVVPGNLVIGFAGNLSPDRAAALAERLVADLPGDPPPPLPALDNPPLPAGRRILVVDKPERTQSQILVGHLGPRYGTRDALALIVVETVFGGTFTSRLMQEIRVKRGWSYGAGCALHRSRGAHWFRIHLAPSAEVTPEALTLTHALLADLARDGITDEELAFARQYMTGSLPFRLATARQRVRIAVQNELFDLPADYVHTLPAALATITREEANAAARAWLHPDDTLSVVVATAEPMVPRLAALGPDALAVLPYDRD
jgi:zinc protease